MSLAFSYDQPISSPASTRRTVKRMSGVGLVFILAYVTLAVVSILVIATKPSGPGSASDIAAFAEL